MDFLNVDISEEQLSTKQCLRRDSEGVRSNDFFVYYRGLRENYGEYINRCVGVVRDYKVKVEEVKSSYTVTSWNGGM